MKTKVLLLFSMSLFALLLSNKIEGQVVYDVPGTYQWTVPPCVDEITVKVWGAGGGGGGTSSHQTGTGDNYEACTEGGGGGGGGFAMRTYAVTPGEVYTIVVGAGGAAGTGVNNNASAGNGGDGGTSTFDGPAVTPFGILTATGGTGGGGATANNTSGWAHIGDNGSGGAGGSGSNGTTNYTGGSGSAGSHSAACHDISGAGGGAAGPGGNGGNAQYIGPCPHPAMNGGSGQAPGGNGANGQQGSINASRNIKNGNDGNAYGGGGSGGSIHLNSWANQWQRSNGGAGAHGAVIIEYDGGNVTPPTASNQEFCENASVGDLVATGQDLNWYDVPTGGTSLNSSEEITSGTYYVSQTINGCESERIPVEVEIFNPFVGNIDDVEECDGYILPVLSGNGAYYSQPNGAGTMYPPGTSITTSGTYYVYMEAGGISGCVAEKEFTITINSSPDVDGGPDQEVCEGVEIILSASNPDGAVITWSDGVIDGVGFIPSATTYTVTAELNGCENTDQVEVTITEGIALTVSSTPPACGSSDGTISFDGVSPNTAYDIEYTDANGVQQGPTAYTSDANGVITITGLQAGTYTDIIVFVDDDDCSIPTGVTVSLSDADAPIVTAPNDVEICLGESVTLVANNPDNGVITWSDNVVDGEPFTPTSAGVYVYTVTSSLSGCISNDNVTVTVNSLPNVNAGNDVSVCVGESVTLNGSGATTYSWSNGINNGVPFNPNEGTTTYTVTGTDANGCVNTDEVTVQVSAQLAPSFEGDVLMGCSPLTVNFTQTSNLGSNVSCEWDFGDGTTSTDCNNVSHTYASAGVYTVSLTVSNASGDCSGTATYTNYIEVVPSPIASFSANPMTISPPEVVNFINNSTNASDYLWDFGDNSPFSTESNPTHVYEEGYEEYVVTLIASNGDEKCNDTTKLTLTTQTDEVVGEGEEEEIIFYVPNAFTPDGDVYNQVFKPVFTSGFDPSTYTLLIFNRWGELIFESHDINIGWDGTYGNDTPIVVQDGTYIWKINIKENIKDKHNEYVGHVTLIR